MPMWSSVANLKESLSKIALDVHDDDEDEDPSIYTSPPRVQSVSGDSVSERRTSRNFSRSNTSSPIVNGFDSPHNHEIELYKTEIRRFQESEAEIKALSVNYASLLKEKEDQILRMTEENGSLKQNLLNSSAAYSVSKTGIKGSGDISPNRHTKGVTKIRSAGSPLTNGTSKHDGLSNGTTSTNLKELSDTTVDHSRSLSVIQATHDAQVKQIMVELDKERGKLASLQSKLQEELKLNGSFQQELSSLKDEKHKLLKEINRTRDELNQKISEIGRLQVELQRRGVEETDDTVEKLKSVITTLEDENRNIKKEKDEFEAALKATRSYPVRLDKPDGVDPSNKLSSSMTEGFSGKEDLQRPFLKLENDLKEAHRKRDKALQELNRLKQHLLEKENEESEKMDEDSKIIEELREINEHQRIQISRLDQALKKAIAVQEEIKMSNSNELMRAKEAIDELNRKLTSCASTIDAKNMEICNLQTALGQYYAEIEAKERLGEDLSITKEEIARLSKQLKEANQQAQTLKREKEEIIGNLSKADMKLADGKNRVKKLEEDNEKLRRALEQSMTRLNRMSVDSDFLVDRRIVIKLLVTYFQRNHSKEVLDLMVRMLGFSDEDKQRIGVAQQGSGKGVVRGVLGLPGRLVGGILGGGSAEVHSAMASDDQSFADLWVDFLLKETEREKKVAADATNGSIPDQNSPGPTPLPDHQVTTADTPTIPRPSSPYSNQNRTPTYTPGNFLRREHSDSEFSTVPLTSSEYNFPGSRVLPRY